MLSRPCVRLSFYQTPPGIVSKKTVPGKRRP